MFNIFASPKLHKDILCVLVETVEYIPCEKIIRASKGNVNYIFRLNRFYEIKIEDCATTKLCARWNKEAGYVFR